MGQKHHVDTEMQAEDSRALIAKNTSRETRISFVTFEHILASNRMSATSATGAFPSLRI